MEPNQSHAASQDFIERHTRDGPWCWQTKETLKQIAEIFDATRDTSSARSVYLALTECASDAGCERFTRRIGEIATRAGVSYNTAAKILQRFEALRLVRIERNLVEGTREHLPSTYTLLHGCARLPNRSNQRPLPKEEKNFRRTSEKKQTRFTSNRQVRHRIDFKKLTPENAI